MKQYLGERKVRRLREKLGLAIEFAMARGNTDHELELYIEGGEVLYYHPASGEIVKPAGALGRWAVDPNPRPEFPK